MKLIGIALLPTLSALLTYSAVSQEPGPPRAEAAPDLRGQVLIND